LHSIIAAATIYVRPAPAPASVAAPSEITCEVVSRPTCDVPPAVEQDRCEKPSRYMHRLAVIRERVIDALLAARATRHSSADCVDALMARGRWWA
jgi:hypothetical protein